MGKDLKQNRHSSEACPIPDTGAGIQFLFAVILSGAKNLGGRVKDKTELLSQADGDERILREDSS
jgi:hypothetical protein